MKCKVKLTHTIECIVEGKSQDAILDWLNCTGPSDVKTLTDSYSESYDDEIICEVKENSEVDYVIP